MRRKGRGAAQAAAEALGETALPVHTPHTAWTPAKRAQLRRVWRAGRIPRAAIAACYGLTEAYVRRLVRG